MTRTALPGAPMRGAWTSVCGDAKVSKRNTCHYLELTVAISVKLDDAMKERVQHLAGLQRRSTHWIVREAIAEYVDREEARESFKQEALASWQAFQETGRHLTGQETRNWLATWGTDDEKEAPECHE